MPIGLLMLLLAVFGCARPQPVVVTDAAYVPSQAVCSAGQQRLERGRTAGTPCHPPTSWWNTVGDALDGAATAVRLPRP